MLKTEGRTRDYVAEYNGKNDKSGFAEISMEQIDIGGEELLLTIVHDITERKRVEKELKVSEEKFSKAFLASPDSISLSSLTDEKLVEMNNGFENIFGYTRDEALGKSATELGLYKNLDDRNTVINLLKSEGHVRNYVAEYNAKDGMNGIAEMSMELIQIGEEGFLLTIVRDITDRIKVEKELKASEEKFSTAFYSSPDSKAISRFSDGVILDINQEYEKIFEFSREEIIGKTSLELGIYNNPSDRTNVYNLLKANNSVKNIEAEFKTKNNNIGVAQFSIDKIIIGGETCLLTSIKDISERKRAEKEIQEYQTNLKSLTSEITLAEEKERRRIAVNLHDHLSQSLAMSKIKLTEVEKEDLDPNTLEKIKEAKNFLDTAINNSRKITYDLSPPVLYDLGFSAAVRWRLDQVERDHNLKTEFVDNVDRMILKDEVKILLFRAAIEIINNTIKHSKATKLTVLINKDKKYLHISFADNGIGFDYEVAEKEATKKRSFGLFSIRERISFIHGELKIDSFIGSGTTINIKIPYNSTIGKWSLD